MNKKSKLLIILLTILSLVGSLLAGCSNNNSEETAATNQTKQGSSSDEPVELTMFVDATWYPFQEWKGEIPELITKATGVKPKITVATDPKQLSLMVASGDLPDIVLSFDFQLMSDGNISLPYNEIFPKYAPNVKFDPIKELVNTVDDGNYYAIRNDFSTEKEWKENPYAHMMVPGLALRQDILKEIGNPEIKTLDDLDTVFEKVKQTHPDMTPLILNPNWTRQFFDAQFGATSGGFADQDGKLVYYLRQPSVEKSMLYVNSLYRNGYVTSENFAYTNEGQTEEMMMSEKGFGYSWTYSGADRLNSSAKDFKFVNVADPLSPNAKIYNTGVGGLGMYVTKNNKNIEATVKFLEYLYSDEGWKLAQWGVEGKDWVWNDKGYPEFKYDPQNMDTLKEKGVYWWGVPTESGVGMAISSFKEGSETTRQGEQYSKIIEFNPAIGMITPKVDSEESIIKNNIDEMVKTEITNVYLAPTEKEAIKAYDELIAKAEKIGMKDLEKWANSLYPDLKKNYEELAK
ncbi:extracellular solute-binding protein [Metabacillus sp. FJAT-53654]|uniref:Extracellular solute-binding protein n=1 Tax=Metabacillus rhizosphaerae TaxID=3117747 RepID=A0ABZ2MT62_9BACI